MVDLTLFSHVDIPYTVYVHLFRVDGDLPRSEARVYSKSIDIEPEGEARREDIAETRQYLVRYDAYEDDSRLTDSDHVHYYPADGGDDEDITFDLHPPGEMSRRR